MSKRRFNWISLGFILLGLYLIIRSWTKVEGAMDINLHNTYFVVSFYHLGIFLGLVLIFIAGIYWLFSKVNRPLNKVLGFIHLGLIAVATVIVHLISFRQPLRRRYFKTEEDSFINFSDYAVFNKGISIIATFFMVGLILMLINMVISLVRKKQIAS